MRRSDGARGSRHDARDGLGRDGTGREATYQSVRRTQAMRSSRGIWHGRGLCASVDMLGGRALLVAGAWLMGARRADAMRVRSEQGCWNAVAMVCCELYGADTVDRRKTVRSVQCSTFGEAGPRRRRPITGRVSQGGSRCYNHRALTPARPARLQANSLARLGTGRCESTAEGQWGCQKRQDVTQPGVRLPQRKRAIGWEAMRGSKVRVGPGAVAAPFMLQLPNLLA